MDINIENLCGDQTIDVTCPGCKHVFSIQFKKISKNGSMIKCPSCKKDINIEHEPETIKNINKVNKQLKDLEKSLKQIGGKLTIK
jgi:predicted Zn finger-like uncharacterized protein